MAERPLVAVTTTIEERSGSHQRPSIFLYTSYLEALERVGLAPVLITPAHAASAIAAIVAACAGVVLTGGEDVEPARYGEQPSPALGTVVRSRDEMEWRVLDAALGRELPVFGICRGMQVLNVYFGGTLYQDLNSERPGEVVHQQAEPWGRGTHYVALFEDTLLRRAVGTERIFINSYHHQGVRELAPSLRATAQAEDGLIEGLEAGGHPWLMGVQWHPERHEASAPETDPDRRIFESFRHAVHAFA